MSRVFFLAGAVPFIAFGSLHGILTLRDTRRTAFWPTDPAVGLCFETEKT